MGLCQLIAEFNSSHWSISLTKLNRYLWAKLSVKMILASPNLEILGRMTSSSYLSQIYLPQPAPTIKRALETIVERPAGELSKMAIIWIAKLKRPLSLAALLESLSIGGGFYPAEVDASVLDRCDGLVMVDEGSSCVHLAHLAPYEIDEAAKEIWLESYSSTVCMLAATCLQYLMLEEFGSGCRETEEELIQLLAARPFLDYAARCWAHHIRDDCDIQSSNAHGESEREDNFETAKSSGISENSGSQDGEPDVKKLSLNDFDGDAGEKNVSNDDNDDTKGVQDLGVTSGPRIQEIAETFLGTPNSLLALQIFLYRDEAAAPFANQWAVHKEKINSMTRLQKATRFGLTTLIDKWAPNGLDLCEKDSEGSTALHEAAKEGFEDVIERLIKDDSLSTLVTNNYKKTPMHLAMARGHHGAFSILFEKACTGFWSELIRREGLEAKRYDRERLRDEWLRRDYAMFANAEDDDNFITYYSIHNSGIPNDPKRSKEMALINAINLRKEGVVFVLLHAGVDGDCKDDAGVHAVHLAIEIGSLPILQLLLENDANPRAKALNHDGESSLHLAARLGKTDIVKLLISEAAGILDVDEKGKTALFSALEASDLQARYEIIRLFLGKGIHIRREDQTGRTIFHAAAEKGDTRALREFPWRMKDRLLKDSKGKTPLDYARERGHEDAERFLRDGDGY